jgi:uncharacterized protein YegJ (DUF2314 family)
MKYPILILFIFIITSCSQRDRENAQEDYDVIGLKASDRNVALAQKAAQDSLHYFVAYYEKYHDNPSYTFFIKSSYQDGESVEHMWSQPIAVEDGKFISILDNIPTRINNYTIGDTVTVEFPGVEDYLMYGESSVIGNYLQQFIDKSTN